MVRTAVPRRIGAPPLLPSLADNDAIEIGQAIRRANGRVGEKPRVLRDIVKAFRRPHRCARCRFACPTGTAVSQGFQTASRIAAPCACSPKTLGNRLCRSLSTRFGISSRNVIPTPIVQMAGGCHPIGPRFFVRGIPASGLRFGSGPSPRLARPRKSPRGSRNPAEICPRPGLCYRRLIARSTGHRKALPGLAAARVRRPGRPAAGTPLCRRPRT